MFPSHYCFTINLPVIPPLWLKRGHHQFSWFAIFVWLWSWGAMGTSLWEEPGVYHLLAISCICFSTCAFQKSQHLWFASQTLDLVAATHVPTTTRSTEMIWGGIAEDTDQEFHAHEHTLHSLDLRVVSCKLLASGADSHYWVSVSPTLNVHRIQLALLGRWESPLQWWVSHLDSDLLHPSFHECAHHIERDGSSNALPFRQDGWKYHVFFLSIVFINYKVTLTLYAFEAVLLLYRLWYLIGFENLMSITIVASVASHILCATTIALVEIMLRSSNASKVDSTDASSLMLGSRHVLRGLCDGDLVLDRRSCRIVDDASCLERLLKSKKKLCDTSLFDLFLDTESRQRFLQFLNTEDENSTGTAIPRGLRVSLQGTDGPVSMDLFHTRIPEGTTGNDYCLLAMKEDPEQKAPPDAAPGSIPRNAFASAPSQTRTQSSSETEIVNAYEELMAIALLFSNETGLLDIKEVHLVFHRQSWAPTIETGMPTLRRFIKPSDWDRIEQMLQNVINLPPANIERRCYFRHPMLFRLPGSSKRYICSRDTYITLGQPSCYPIDPQRPIHFQMHLSSFDSTHVRRPREQELEGIDEEWLNLAEILGTNCRSSCKRSCRSESFRSKVSGSARKSIVAGW